MLTLRSIIIQWHCTLFTKVTKFIHCVVQSLYCFSLCSAEIILPSEKLINRATDLHFKSLIKWQQILFPLLSHFIYRGGRKPEPPLTSSWGDSESSLSDRYMAMWGMCATLICSSVVSSPQRRRTSWLTRPEGLALGTSESITLPATPVSRVKCTWNMGRKQE